VAAGSDDDMPDIAVSTGSADTLECLLARIGVSAREYTAGADDSGHVHLFAGGRAAVDGGDDSGVGVAESPPVPGAPPSDKALWASQAQLMPYDLALMSCEGGETYDANPAALEAYLNAGGRVLASHFHYAWFAGPIASRQGYAAPVDWGSSLATWTPGHGEDDTGAMGGVIDTTFNGLPNPFPGGYALQLWLNSVGALGQGGAQAGQLLLEQPRFNAAVGPANTPSQPWITTQPGANDAGAPMVFSFDTPIIVPPAPPSYSACGRALFSELHASGEPSSSNLAPAPAGCPTTELSPQETALEFMLFELTACAPPIVHPPLTLPDW
jgi:hypothetical protein